MNITIKEIAAIAKVSPATVSLALNNKPGIREATRQKIRKIAQTLEDERNKQHAFTRITKGSIRFLKIVKHGQVLNRDHEVFISRYIDGMEQEARANGYNLEINTFKTPDVRETIAHLKDASIDGLIVLGTEFNDRDFGPFESLDIPIGILDTNFDFKNFDFVDMDNIEAVFQIIHHFIEHNHQEIGFIKSPVEVRNFELRYLGFQRALNYFEIPYNNKYVFSVNSTFDGAYHDMLQILKKGPKLPTALFSSNDLIAYACIKAFKEMGIMVPDDVSIIGFDDLPMSAMMDPPLTTMKVSQRQIGQMAIRLILGRIDCSFSAPTIKINIGGELISRKSVKTL
jgi:LacI family transcriptional regulator